MVVSTTTAANGKLKHFEGTVQEVLDAIEAEGPRAQVITMYEDGTNENALVRLA